MLKSQKKATNSVLVVAAHPDDEVLGCGATIAKHAKAGHSVHILILGEGITSREGQSHVQNRELNALGRSARQAARILGAASIELFQFPDNRMDTVALLDLVKVIESHIERVRPSIVYTHHNGDVNIDHRRVHEAVIASCRPQPAHPVKSLLFFEVSSSTEWRPPTSHAPFAPTWYNDVSATWEHKHRALQAYRSEMRAFPHPRSLKAVEHLARWRGASIGVACAEAFMTGRHIT